jgi:large subunit ribosomal protein L13
VNTLSYKTVSANKATANKEWVVVDAEEQPLGRLASTVAKILRGKHKTNYTPHVDCGDNVIVLNAGKVTLSGNKWADKTYIWHTGYPGGQKSMTAEELKKRFFKVLEKSVKGMLPKNRLGAAIQKPLFI